MATPKTNENCHYVQNDPHKCKIKLKNLTVISCAVLELLRKVFQGGRNPPLPPGEIALNDFLCDIFDTGDEQFDILTLNTDML